MDGLTKVTLRILQDSVVRIPSVPDEEYFGDEYKDFVSNSSLKHINPDEGGSAYNYANRSNKQTNSMELGTAVHRIVLEGEKYLLADVEKPTGKLAAVVDEAYRMSKDKQNNFYTYSGAMAKAMAKLDYYGKALTEVRIQSAIEDGRAYFDFLHATKDNDSLITLPADLRTRLLKATASIKANKEIDALLHPSSSIFDIRSFSEDVLTAVVEIEYEEDDLPVTVQIPVKCKIDNWSIDLDNKVITLNDLKTSGSSIQNFMGRWTADYTPVKPDLDTIIKEEKFIPGSFQKWHYHRQMAMYARMLTSHCIKEYEIEDVDEWTVKVNMICAETIAPFNAYSFEVSSQWLKAGEDELATVMARLAWHTKNGFDKLIELDNGRMEPSLCSQGTS